MILYLADADITAGFFETLTESPPSAIEEAQGWTVDKKSGAVAAGYRPDAWRLAADFVSPLPPAFTGYGYRTVNPLTGSFAAGNWSLAFKVKSNSYYAQGGMVGARLWKSTAADGSGAVLVATWSLSSQVVFTAANQYQAGSYTIVSSGALTFANEYLFLEILWDCVVSGGNNAATVAWVHNEGAAEALTTPAFTPPSGLFVQFAVFSGFAVTGVAVNPVTGDVYVTIFNSYIFKQTGGSGDFVQLNVPVGQWYGIAVNSVTGDVYACVSGGDIYKQPGGSGDFVALGQTARSWRDIAINSATGDVYACVYYGDIYKQPGGSGDFVALGQTSMYWYGLAVNQVTNDVYACVFQGYIYKQAGGGGDFAALTQTSGDWNGLAVNPVTNDVYACFAGIDIYKQAGGIGDFVALGQTARSWSGIAVNHLTGEGYAVTYAAVYRAIDLFPVSEPIAPIDLNGQAIPAADAFGLPTITQAAADQTINLTGGGISSAEAFGLPTITQAAAGLTIDLTDQGIPTAEVVSAPTVAITIQDYQLAEAGSWPWSTPAPTFSWQIQPSRPRQEIHICVLTGGHVSLPDIELPISSWQARLRNGDPTYVSAIVPNALTYANAIIARTGGQLKVYKGYQFIDLQGGRFLALVAETTLNSIRHDTGPRSSSVTLVGYANITTATPKTFAYDTLTYKSLQADGRRRWRTGLKLNLSEAMAGDSWTFIARPGDTVTHQGESMVVGFISLAVSDTFELVELVES